MDPYGDVQWSHPLVPVDICEFDSRWPTTITERMDRALCNLAALSSCAGARIPNSTVTRSVLFAINDVEQRFIRSALADLGLIVSPDMGGLQVTPAGWGRVHELARERPSPENPAFVAMWFGDLENRRMMDGVFEAGIRPAIRRAGFYSVRSDLMEHNEWIMDKVFGEIRRAPFVVADFTGHRNGVYLEAGFARGLGIPVIHTCRKSEMHQAHFDTAQFNHVVWEDSADLELKLFHRIAATIGLGPLEVKPS